MSESGDEGLQSSLIGAMSQAKAPDGMPLFTFASVVGLIFFFIIHYGFFVFVQTQLFFGVSRMIPDGSLIMNYSKIPELLGNNGRLMLIIFITYYTVQSIFSS